MYPRRFTSTVVLSIAGCCSFIAIYYWFKNASIDGNYTEWSAWGNCSKSCGEGVQMRYRKCSNPAPGRFGKDCYRLGENQDKKPCFLKICPMDGKFSEWSQYSACDKTCGGGKQLRARLCNNPPAAFGGKACEGSSREEIDCNNQPCPAPVDGGFTEWTEYGPCSVTCGQGSTQRTRSCTNPSPSNGGKPCSGPTTDIATCDKEPCPVVQAQKPEGDQIVQGPNKPEIQKTEDKADAQPQKP